MKTPAYECSCLAMAQHPLVGVALELFRGMFHVAHCQFNDIKY
jgi:hypothetical protein